MPIDLGIMKAISDLKVPYPKADKINSLVNLDPEELGARRGSLEMEGYVQTKSEADIGNYCLPKAFRRQG